MSAVSVSDTEVRSNLAGAVDLARSALLELEPSGVGAHVGVRAEDEYAATHCFEATLPGYHGWQWAVVVASAPDTDRVTVSESALLPGPDALIAPEFVPWEQRVRPGDLAPGDLLAPPADDPRLAPGYTATGDPEIDEVAYQVGLGRKQVLSYEGRLEAAQRWYEEYGPETDMAKAAPASCESCGFYVPLAGALRAAFGVCANAMGADGHVVHMGYGCGAHSETPVPAGSGSPLYEAYDDAAVEVYPVDASKSAEAEAPKPAETDAQKPAEADALKPADTEALEPAEAESPNSVDTDAQKPAEIEVPKSAEAEAPKPVETESVAEAPVVAESATGTVGDGPVASGEQERGGDLPGGRPEVPADAATEQARDAGTAEPETGADSTAIAGEPRNGDAATGTDPEPTVAEGATETQTAATDTAETVVTGRESEPAE